MTNLNPLENQWHSRLRRLAKGVIIHFFKQGATLERRLVTWDGGSSFPADSSSTYQRCCSDQWWAGAFGPSHNRWPHPLRQANERHVDALCDCDNRTGARGRTFCCVGGRAGTLGRTDHRSLIGSYKHRVLRWCFSRMRERLRGRSSSGFCWL